jgi:hypothetical protein
MRHNSTPDSAIIARAHDALPPPDTAVRRLLGGGSLHLTGRRTEALVALGLGPALGLSASLLGLLGMLAFRAPLAPLLGPGLGLVVSLVWALYAALLLRAPKTETGIHLDGAGLLSSVLGRRETHHQIPWSEIEAFEAEGGLLLARLTARPAGAVLAPELYQDGRAALALPETFPDAGALASYLEEARQRLRGAGSGE